MCPAFVCLDLSVNHIGHWGPWYGHAHHLGAHYPATAGFDLPAWITAIATAVLAVGAFVALFQLRESRNSRHTETAARLSEKWDSESFARAREKIDAFETIDEFLEAVRPPDGPERAALLKELTYFEEMAGIEEMGAISLRWIDIMMRQRVLDRWEVWSPIIERLREGPPAEPTMFANFEKLVDRLNGRSLKRNERLRRWLVNLLAP